MSLPTCYTSAPNIFVTDKFTVHYWQRRKHHLQYQWQCQWQCQSWLSHKSCKCFNSSHIQLILQMLQFLHFLHSSTQFVCRRIWQGQPKLQELTGTHLAACRSWKVSLYLYTPVQWKVGLQLQKAMHQLCVLNTTLNVGKPNWWCQSFYGEEHSLEAKPWSLKLKKDPTMRAFKNWVLREISGSSWQDY
jgi:hypothetical protein